MTMTGARLASRRRTWLCTPTSLLPLACVAGIACLGGAWLLASGGIVLSRQRTPDLFFGLAGAWYLDTGSTPHVDFHDPLGTLYFRLIEYGFRLVGPGVRAILAAELIATTLLFVAATIAAWRRLPLLPAALFVASTCFMVLVPANPGSGSGAFTFAMTYNRIGWAGLAILLLILFLPPRHAGPQRKDWLDLSTALLLLVALYQLKVTYFLAAAGAFAVALAVCPKLGERRLAWSSVGALALLNAVAPYNWPYLQDIAATLSSGGAQTNLRILLGKLVASHVELALCGAALVLAIGLWRSGRAPVRLPVAIAACLVASLAVLSQNTQASALPACLVIAFLLYEYFDDRPAILIALLVFPMTALARDMATLAAYQAATRAGDLEIVRDGPLTGLAVRRDREDLIEAFSRPQADDSLLNRARTVETGGDELTQFEYLQTLLEATDLLRSTGGPPGPVALLDQVNPIPFTLRQPPPRGVGLWLHVGFPWPAPDAMLGDARHVLLPKFPMDSAAAATALDRYGDYIERHFPVRTESRSWTLASRR